MTTHQNTTLVKHCPKCGETKPLSEFHPNKRTKFGVNSYCRLCQNTNTLARQRARTERKQQERRAALGDIIAPDTKIIGADGRDWSWAYAYFKEPEGFRGYLVATYGRAWGCRTGLIGVVGYQLSRPWDILKGNVLNTGYIQVRLYGEDRVAVCKTLHRLVMETFLGSCPIGMDVCHNDGDKTNNDIRNLRWDTKAGNMADKKIHGTSTEGSRNPFAKLTEDDIPFIRSLAASGVYLEDIGKQFGITKSTVWAIVKRKSWKHIT